MLFINTLKAPFINHMLGSATKSFLDIVMSREMIENAVRSGKIEARKNTRRSAPRKKKMKLTKDYDHQSSRPFEVRIKLKAKHRKTPIHTYPDDIWRVVPEFV
ncbi:dynactin subunit 1-like [Gossypium australe]|uniref:Dynactin subunit 1-like n=1 Tax=Gossypium australe TaxID=47621 RepID=A0A5B6VTV9_9ROSI|nr:dynactin subunit 1-like [Gossypium australe]